MNGNTGKGCPAAVRALLAAVSLIGAAIVLLTVMLLVFGSKTVGTYKETRSVNGSRYTYAYTYTVDGQEYEYVTTKRFPRGEGEHSTQKISYLSAAPSVAYTDAKLGAGMALAGVFGLAFFMTGTSGGNRNGNRNAGVRTVNGSKFLGYVEKVKSGRKSG